MMDEKDTMNLGTLATWFDDVYPTLRRADGTLLGNNGTDVQDCLRRVAKKIPQLESDLAAARAEVEALKTELRERTEMVESLYREVSGHLKGKTDGTE